MGDKRKRSQAVGDDDIAEAAGVTNSKKIKKSSSGKEKKDKKSSKDGKKRRKDEAKEVNGDETPIPEIDVKSEEKKKKEKRDKKEKKEKKEKDKKEKKAKDRSKKDTVKETTETNGSSIENSDKQNYQLPNPEMNGELKKEKKKKKDKKAQKESKDTNEEPKEEVNGDATVAEPPTSSEQDITIPPEEDDHIHPDRKQGRFIVFISNLPYTADYDAVSKHFAKLQPAHIRVPQERGGKKGRGFAFVEFAHYDRMKTCLKLYHHTMFDDGKSPARKIGVELTAGGGGSSEARKTKIMEKNQKLNEERARSAKEAAKRKRIEEKKNQGSQQNGDENGTEESNGLDDIHPSRRTRFQ
ncbi:hypothetical protein LOZ53_001672 [Ophidiomyces ophidiicola]|nr:hypothetical protein LOZ55_000955 [Ophidiomyces ophidiicola]KAI1990464.1 hypothetical protein LOZ51_004815 [Ophidiomyces ophidiicola]KAI1991396.1 hypothetical protein LOZ54_002150 [Ophidiomyces ophidiicola]KAI1994905.1 hypothetical protein LOZ53_001672 [Ophidiomyces ophidiicola]